MMQLKSTLHVNVSWKSPALQASSGCFLPLFLRYEISLWGGAATMSGIEVAGLIFGAFPLIISAMEHGRTVVKVGRLHRRMREEYNNCRSDVKYYQMWYDRNLRTLLQSIVHEQDEVDRLLADPGGTLWREDQLQKLLEDRLQDSYSVYVNIMQRLNETMVGLKDELCVDSASVQSHLVVAKTTQRSTSPSSISSTFSKLTIAKSRVDYEAFRIKFSLNETGRKELFGQLEECNTRLEKLLALSDKAPGPIQDTAAASNKQISKLQSVFKQARKKSNALYRAMQESWKCQCQEHHYANLRLEHRLASDKMAFQMILNSNAPSAKENLWHWEGICCSQISHGCSCSEALGMAHSAHSAVSLPLPSKPNPPVRAISDVTDNTQTNKVWKKAPKKVQIHDPQELVTMKFPNVQLCQRLAKYAKGDACLGTITHDDETYHINPQAAAPTDESTLGDVLSGAERLTRRRRYLIALLLASSIAQLQTTPWLSNGITKDDVLFYTSSGAHSGPGKTVDAYEEPYIRKGFLSGETSSLTAPRQDELDLSLLGIILLELCFGQRLEDQPARKKYPDMSGEEKHMFDLVVAMTWAKSVRDEGGPDYATAVQWCFGVGGGYSTQSSDSWRSDMIKNVVVPLVRCQEHFQMVSTSA
jgi:hypothetical protein